MAYLALGGLALLGAFWLLRWLSTAKPSNVSYAAIVSGLLVGFLVLMVLALSGRMAAAGALGFILLYAVRLLREWRTVPPTPPAPQNQTTMSRAEALDLLGLKEGARAAEVDAAYKNLIKKNHPDQGGTDGLTRQLNEARRVLKDD